MQRSSTTASKGKILENRLRKKIRTLVEDVLKEEPRKIDPNDMKTVLRVINSLSDATTPLNYSVNDRTLKGFADGITKVRMEIMEYVEQNSDYTFYGKSPNGFKLVKKGR